MGFKLNRSIAAMMQAVASGRTPASPASPGQRAMTAAPAPGPKKKKKGYGAGAAGAAEDNAYLLRSKY